MSQNLTVGDAGRVASIKAAHPEEVAFNQAAQAAWDTLSGLELKPEIRQSGRPLCGQFGPVEVQLWSRVGQNEHNKGIRVIVNGDDAWTQVQAWFCATKTEAG